MATDLGINARTAERMQIRDVLLNRFSDDELENLVFELGDDFETISSKSNTKSKRVIDLIQYFEKRGKLAELKTAINSARPDVTLGSAAGNAIRLAAFAPMAVRTLIPRLGLLSEIKTRITKPGAANVLCLTGIGGIGKTALAIMLWRDEEFCSTHFPGGSIWLDLRNGDLVGKLRELADALGGGPEPIDDESKLAARVRAALSGKRLLLVCDNVDVLNAGNPAAVSKSAQELLALPHPASTLFTSRAKLNFEYVDIEGLSESDAINLVQERLIGRKGWTATGLQFQDGDVKRLIGRLQGHALALELALAHLLERDMNFAQLQRHMDEARDTVSVLQKAGYNDKDANLAECFALSYRQLPANLRRVFHALAVCAPAGVQPFALAAMLDQDVNGVRADLANLQRRMLAQLARRDDDEYVLLHPLLREFANVQAKQGGTYDELVLLHVRYFGDRVGGEGQRMLQKGNAEGQINALVDADRVSENIWHSQSHALDERFPDPELALLTTLLNHQYFKHRRLLETQPQLLRAIDLARAQLRFDFEAYLLNEFGDVQAFKGERDLALKSYGEAQRLFQTEGDRLGQANVLQRIGDVQAFKGERDLALKSYGEAQRLFIDTGATLSPAITQVSEARVYLDCGNNAQAVALCESPLALFIQREEFENEITTRIVLGRATSNRADFDIALKLCEQTGDVTQSAEAHFYLGLQLKASGNPGEARMHLVAARDQWQALGAPHRAREADQARQDL